MANYPDDKERETIYYEAPDENRDANINDYYGHEPAKPLVGARCKKGHKGQNAQDVLLPIGQEST
jgi:hypothetical protein